MLLIRSLEREDYAVVRKIYEEGIATKLATFETKTPDWPSFNVKFLEHSRIVAVREKKICGWATLSAVSKRPVYRGVAEVSIYVGQAARGQGVGDALLKALIEASETNGIWTLQAVIFAENESSVRLHKKHDFRLVGRREKIAQLHGIWKNTLLLERRSKKV